MQNVGTDFCIKFEKLLHEIENALKQYFDNFEVLAVEFPLHESIEGEEEYKFKGFIDLVLENEGA